MDPGFFVLHHFFLLFFLRLDCIDSFLCLSSSGNVLRKSTSAVTLARQFSEEVDRSFLRLENLQSSQEGLGGK